MRSVKSVLWGFALAWMASSAFAASCPVDQGSFERDIAAIQAQYGDSFQALGEETKRQADEISDDQPTPNAASATVNIDLKIGSKKQEFIFDVPSFTSRDHAISFSVPTTSMNRQSFKYSVPTTRTTVRCIPGPPETVCGTRIRCVLGVCTKIPWCEVRQGNDICTDVPEVYMREVETILDAPAVTMRTQRIVTAIPEIRLDQTKISFNVPTFTVENVRAEAKELKEEADALEQQATQKTEQLKAGMDADIQIAAARMSAAQYGCSKAQIERETKEKLVDLDNQIAVVQAAHAKAVEVGATSIANQQKSVLEQMVKARAEFQAATEKALLELSDLEAKEIAKLQKAI